MNQWVGMRGAKLDSFGLIRSLIPALQTRLMGRVCDRRQALGELSSTSLFCNGDGGL